MTDIGRYAWNKQFRERIIALCFLPDWFSRYGYSIVKPEFFEVDEEQEVVEFLVNFYKTYMRPPDEDEIMAEFYANEDAQELLESVLTTLDEEEDQLDFARTTALQFAREQAMKLAILESVDDIEKGVLSKIIGRVTEALDVGSDLSNLGVSVKDDYRAYLHQEHNEKIPTGIVHLDEVLEGGLSRGEYGVLLGPTNIGKTLALINIGFGAASWLFKANVTHVTLEMTPEKIARRYAARTAGRFYKPDEKLDDFVLDFEHYSHLRLPGQIRVKGWPPRTATIKDLNNYLDRLESSGYKTDILLIDYPDIMDHGYAGEYRHALSNTTMAISALAQQRDIAIWGASQAGRQALNKELVDLDDVAEDIGKVQIADVVAALSQTKEEYDEGMLRIFGAKMRDGAKFWTVRCVQLNDSHSIESVELMTYSEVLQRKAVDSMKQNEEAKAAYAKRMEEKKVEEANKVLKAIKNGQKGQ